MYFARKWHIRWTIIVCTTKLLDSSLLQRSNVQYRVRVTISNLSYNESIAIMNCNHLYVQLKWRHRSNYVGVSVHLCSNILKAKNVNSGINLNSWVLTLSNPWGGGYQTQRQLTDNSGLFTSNSGPFQSSKIGVNSSCLEETSIFKIITTDDVTLWSKLESTW